MSDNRVKQAFKAVRGGRSAEYVICDHDLGAAFLAAAQRLGVPGDDRAIFVALLGLRKQNKLKDCPTTCRKKADPQLHRYQHAVLNAVRLVERQFGTNVDEVICDPNMRAQFEAMVQYFCPGASSFESRYAALSLRKSNRLKPEPIGQVIRALRSKAIKVLDLESRLSELPLSPGVYIFFDQNKTLYAGKADRLRTRVTDHISTWTFRDLIQQIKDGQRDDTFVVYHELPVTISPRELAAYEIELIRSRNPEHNRAGKSSEGP